MNAHYRVTHTKAGYHVSFIGGNGETVVHGEPVSSSSDACKAIKAIGRAHSPYQRAELAPQLDAVHVWWGLGDRPYVAIPVEWVDERKAPLPVRGLARAMGSLLRPPRLLRDHAAVAVQIADGPAPRNGDSHDA